MPNDEKTSKADVMANALTLAHNKPLAVTARKQAAAGRLFLPQARF